MSEPEPRVAGFVSVMRVREPAPTHLLADVHDLLAASPGYVAGHIARNVDDPGLWLLTSWWEGAGSCRRALSSYDVKMQLMPLMSSILDEPSSYLVVP